MGCGVLHRQLPQNFDEREKVGLVSLEGIAERSVPVLKVQPNPNLPPAIADKQQAKIILVFSAEKRFAPKRLTQLFNLTLKCFHSDFRKGNI